MTKPTATTTSSKENLRMLLACLRDCEDPREALRQFTGDTLSGMAARTNTLRTDMNMMLSPRSTRRYTHIRRQLEAEYNLPIYSLDDLLDQEGAQDGDGESEDGDRE